MKIALVIPSVTGDDNTLILQRAESLVTPSDASADGYTRADCKWYKLQL
jgi:hypothetical protein